MQDVADPPKNAECGKSTKPGSYNDLSALSESREIAWKQSPKML